MEVLEVFLLFKKNYAVNTTAVNTAAVNMTAVNTTATTRGRQTECCHIMRY